MAYPSTPDHQSDPYTPRHVRDAVRHARTLLPRDRIAFEVLVILASAADRTGKLDPAPGVRYIAEWAVRAPETVSRALGRLDRNGLIAWERRRGARSRITLSWVIHTARPVQPRTSLSTGARLSSQNTPEVRGLCGRAEEVLRTEEDARAIDCLGCGRPAGHVCPLAEASGCQRLDQASPIAAPHVIDLMDALGRLAKVAR